MGFTPETLSGPQFQRIRTERQVQGRHAIEANEPTGGVSKSFKLVVHEAVSSDLSEVQAGQICQLVR